jgi:hypothetical protein
MAWASDRLTQWADPVFGDLAWECRVAIASGEEATTSPAPRHYSRGVNAMKKLSENLVGINRDCPDDDIVLEPDTPESWKRDWRTGIVPQLTIRGLEGLKLALEQDRPSLITAGTMQPPPLACMANEAVEGCCPGLVAASRTCSCRAVGLLAATGPA